MTQEPALEIQRLDKSALGKTVGEHLYLHISKTQSLPVDWQVRIALAAQLAGLSPETHFNVAKLHQDGDQLSLLDYASFFDDPFPPLARSWRISLSRKTVVFRTYQESRNPPILHRKELLLAADDPRRADFAAITESAEAIGLFTDPNRIGFLEYWYRLIAERGYELVGNEFVPLANTTASTTSEVLDESSSIQRHMTALSRSNFSAPVQALSRHGLIRPGVNFFDYGCGRGDDVRGLLANSIDATGWDPHFAAEAEKRISDVVNIGFVINVIEDMGERVEALRGATNWATLGPRTNTDLTRIWVGEAWKTSFAGIPYKGGPPIMNALVAGEVDFTVQGVYIGIELVKSGKAKLLALSSSKRIAMFPNVPTLKELGLGEAPVPWWGLLVPAGTPDAIVTRLNTEVVRVFRDPKFGEFLESLVTESNVGTPQEFAALMKSEYQKFGQMIKRYNITPE